MKIFRINRKYFVLCVFVLGMFTMHACLKDEGNYAYIELPRFYIDTVGQQTTFEVQQSVG